jgi:hypothetical protein
MIRKNMVENTDLMVLIFVALLFPKVLELSLARRFRRRWSYHLNHCIYSSLLPTVQCNTMRAAYWRKVAALAGRRPRIVRQMT